MVPRLPRRVVSLTIVSLAVSLAAVAPAAAQMQGILAPLSPTCEQNTHRIVDVCTGEEFPVWSSSFDLNAFACQTVLADGTPVGQICPGTDLTAITLAELSCPLEVFGVQFQVDPNGRTTLLWAPLPCADSYDVIRGVAGNPAVNACDAQHPCPAGTYCQRNEGSCGTIGTCRPEPIACSEVFDPVCGCDGKTYSNDCFAGFGHTSVACQGVCPCPPACRYDEGCIAGGPVFCPAYGIPATSPGLWEPQAPFPGQAFFYLVRAHGAGAVGITSYGVTSDGSERLFSGPGCPP